MNQAITKRPDITRTLRTGIICTPYITRRKRASTTRRNMAAKAKQAKPSQPGKSGGGGVLLTRLCLRDKSANSQSTSDTPFPLLQRQAVTPAPSLSRRVGERDTLQTFHPCAHRSVQ